MPSKEKKIRSCWDSETSIDDSSTNYSSLVKPLTNLTRKDIPWKWEEEEQRAFQGLKDAICSEPVLAHPDPEKQYFMEMDASGVVIGAILSQRQDDGYLHPIAFRSQSFKPAELNYDTFNKELLAIVDSCKEWRLYLEGTKHEIIVLTDHRNLQYWKDGHTFNRQHWRWHEMLPDFKLKIIYRPGVMSTKPDILSRRGNHVEPPSQEQIMLSANKFVGFKANIIEDLPTALAEAQKEDDSLDTLISMVQNMETLPATIRKQFRDYHWAENLLWYQGKVIVPHNKDLCLRILQIHHESPAAGHLGQSRTLELISRCYWWPGMKAEINNFVDSCETCQRSKGSPQKLPLMPLHVAEGPWKDITYDMIVKLPISRIGKESYDSIFTVTDRYYKMAHYYPC